VAAGDPASVQGAVGRHGEVGAFGTAAGVQRHPLELEGCRFAVARVVGRAVVAGAVFVATAVFAKTEGMGLPPQATSAITATENRCMGLASEAGLSRAEEGSSCSESKVGMGSSLGGGVERPSSSRTFCDRSLDLCN